MTLAVESGRFDGRRLGLRPTSSRALMRMIRLPLRAGALPAYPPTWNDLTAPQWCLGGNDRFGTCGPTSAANYLVMLYWVLKGERVTVTDDAVFALYRLSGNPDFDPDTGAGDNGVDMATMLDALLKHGITITHEDGSPELVKPYCYAAVPEALTDLYAVTANLGGAILAATLETAQQSQTDASPPLWDYKRSSTWGGHAFLGGSYTGSAIAHTADVGIITWQMPVGTTDTFIGRQLQEAYVPVFPVLWASDGFQQGVDGASLAAAYEAITGRPFTGPPPAPQPAPLQYPADPADSAFNMVAGPWAEQYRSRPDLVTLKGAIQAWQSAKTGL